ncbi:MAG: transcription antitermination factor NusB [Burkholderiaceae bacterium]
MTRRGEARGGAGGTAPKNARRRAREMAVQGLYQWLLAGEDAGVIEAHVAESTPGFAKADVDYFKALLHGTLESAVELDEAIVPYLDRKSTQLSPVEHAVLLVSAFELLRMPEVPYRVVINEAVELTKTFGGTDGYKYVNGVLDRVALQLRPHEAGGRA